MTNGHHAKLLHQRLSAADGSKDASPNMIGEQILELRDGLSSFQSNAFESLYDKKVSWIKDGAPETISIPLPEEIVSEVKSDMEDAVTLPEETKVLTVVVEEVPAAAKAVSNLIVKPIAVVDKEANKDVIAVRNIPVRSPPAESEELAAENKKRAIIKAQQAVTQSFLSLQTVESEPESESEVFVTSAPEPAVVSGTKTAPEPEPAAGGFFSFLKSDNAVQNIAKLKPTAAPSIAKAFMTSTAPVVKATDNVDSEVKKAAIMSRPSISDLKAEISSAAPVSVSPEVPTGGFFGFLKQPIPSIEKVVAKKVPEPAAVKVEPVVVKAAPVVEELKKSAATGFFSFLNSDPNIAVPTNKAPVSNVAKVFMTSPLETKVIVEEEEEEEIVPTPVSSKALKATSSGGLFGFLKPTTVPEIVQVKKSLPPVVVAKVQVPSPAPVQVPKSTIATPVAGGFFGFLNPGPSSNTVQISAPNEEVVAPAVAKKLTVAVPQAKTPVSRVVSSASITKTSEATNEGGGFFSFLSPQSGSKKSESITKEVVTPITKTTAAKNVVVPVKSIESKAVAMNTKFQSAVSKLLKGDSNKIRTFQRATDDFRSDDVSGEDFMETLLTLFGTEALESVVVPLISELPERKMAAKLQSAYDKKMLSITKAANPAKSPFSFSFGNASKKPTNLSQAAPMVAVVSVAPINEKKFMSGGPKARSPVTVSSVKEIIFKVPSKVPVAKKVSIEKQMKSLLAGSTDVKTFYSAVSKELGKEKTKEVMPDIIAVFPAEIRTKIDGVFRADK